jgi:putative ABC transport system permease protein
MNGFVTDARYALRSLSRNPGFSAAAVGILALGIGATTAVFSVIDSVFFQPLPIEGPGTLVRLRDYRTAADGRREEGNTSAASFEAIREQSRVFDRLGAFVYGSASISNGDLPERVCVVGVTGGLGPTLGVPVGAGRDFRQEEIRRGRESGVALISHSLAARRFPGTAGVDSVLLLDGTPYTVVGVLTEGFRFPYEADVWVPTRLSPGDEPAVFATLKPGVSIARANAELETIAARRRGAEHEASAGFGMIAIPGRRSLMGDEDRIAIGLLALVGFFLLLTCADVGSLMLGRAVSRRTETAIRAALGASRGRLLAGALIEASIISFLAAGFGLLLFGWLRPPLATLIPGNFRDQLGLSQPRFDAPLAFFVLAAATLCALLCAAIPGLPGSVGRDPGLLRDGTRSAGPGRRVSRALSGLVAGEVALALTLLCGAALFALHFWKLERRDLGIRPREVLTLQLALPANDDGGRRSARVSEILASVRSVPGVSSAGATIVNPLAGGTWVSAIDVDGFPPPDERSQFLANYRQITPGLAASLGMTLREGRDFADSDAADQPPVALVSESLARRFWPRESALGKRVRVARGRAGSWRTVVGVVSDVADAGEVRDAWYLPYAQTAGVPGSEEIHLMVRAAPGIEPASLGNAVARAIARVDRRLAAFNVRSQETVRRQVLSRERFGSALIAVLASFGLCIALVGAYAVASFRVERRRREIAVRLALGARRAQVISSALGEGLRPVAIGLAAGVLLTAGETAILRGLVPGLPSLPRLTGLGIAGALALAAALGLLVPSWRAARTDPVAALRGE